MARLLSLSIAPFYLLLLIAATGCKRDEPVEPVIPELPAEAGPAARQYKTENVVILIIDGPRMSDTWNEPKRQFIPYRAALMKEGVYCSRFYNHGTTATNPGHQAICTGNYENIDNSGNQYPTHPSIFQYWLKDSARNTNEAWIIASKDKLEVLSDCTMPGWKGLYRPRTDCGNSGLHTGYRLDSMTYIRVSKIFTQNHVRLALINFKEPDASGHAADSLAYLKGIRDTDKYVRDFWNLLQSNPVYKDKTTLLVTNDHGRHSPGWRDGYISHGDDCEGCKHLEFLALGPDFKQNHISNLQHEQIDIASTVAELMGFSMPTSKGKVMKEFLVE